ncbi:hypothetical protein ABZ016_40005 [Streptomyces sp. NPDC006372]|uniref:hypothetical protein n=1 Tax=Streptomyces sp. NPDC006372 TaxID=3155599 RepID=UPI0033BBCE0A
MAAAGRLGEDQLRFTGAWGGAVRQAVVVLVHVVVRPRISWRVMHPGPSAAGADANHLAA